MDSVKLIRALASLCGGGSTFKVDDQVENLKKKIGEHEHYLFILLDGFGNYFLERNPNLSFLKEKRVQVLRSVFPSTTASALSSLGTAQYPSKHGAIGWWTHLTEYDLTSVYLPFRDRVNFKPLHEKQIKPEEMYYEPSFYSTLTRRSKCYVPKYYVNSEFSRYSRADTLGQGYEKFDEAMKYAEEFAFNGEGPSFQYFYFPQIDGLEHEHGTQHPDVIALCEEVCAKIKEFSERHAGKIRIVISADHGLIDIPDDNNLLMNDEFPLMSFLKVPPACETRVPMFFLKDLNDSQKFVECFNEFFDEQFVLISKEDAKKKQILGDEWDERAWKRVGDFIALPKGPWTLQYHGESIKALILKGVHGALSPEETQVPLIII